MNDAAAAETLSYEDAIAELEGIIGTLEKGSLPLQEAMSAYERGSLLIARCQALLQETEQKITMLAGKGGSFEETPVAMTGEQGEADLFSATEPE